MPLLARSHKRRNFEPRPSDRNCPRCGGPLVWNQSRTVEYCRAPNPDDPLRVCGYFLHHKVLYVQRLAAGI